MRRTLSREKLRLGVRAWPVMAALLVGRERELARHLAEGADDERAHGDDGHLAGGMGCARWFVRERGLDCDRDYLRSVESSSTRLTANVWTRLTVTFTAKSSQAYAAMAPSFSGATKGTTVLAWDDMGVTAG
jgi:hypothetical protein